ncbi:MAG: metallophosphoesterase, partial [Phycisphaeraceae bacterium]|nr:metallophosphoesterase [Phycisphaeraceae bacterium]
QVSDLHLDPRRTEHRERFEKIRAAIESAEPDVIVASGDLTDDAYEHDGMFAAVKDWLDELPAPVLSIPGNHDVGNKASVDDFPVRPQWLQMWDDVFETDRFEHATDDWSLIGINSQILGSGDDREADQSAWLARAIERAVEAGQSVALFLHTPPYIVYPGEPSAGGYTYWNIDPAARQRLLKQIAHPAVKIVGHGHLHWYRITPREDTTWVGCPSASIPVDDPIFPRGGASLGVLKYVLGPDTFDIRRIDLDIEAPTVYLRRPLLQRLDGGEISLRELIVDAGSLTGERLSAVARDLEPVTHELRVTVVADDQTTADTYREAFVHLPIDVFIADTVERRQDLVRELDPTHTALICPATGPREGFEDVSVTLALCPASDPCPPSADAAADDLAEAIHLFREPAQLALRIERGP